MGKGSGRGGAKNPRDNVHLHAGCHTVKGTGASPKNVRVHPECAKKINREEKREKYKQ